MAQNDFILECAKIIENSQTPAEPIIAYLTNIAIGIRQSIMQEAHALTRQTMREHLEKLGKAAALVRSSLTNPSILQWLDERPPLDPNNSNNIDLSRIDPNRSSEERVACQVLERIANRCEQLIAQAPRGQGNYKIYPNEDGITAEELCILGVSTAWRHCRGGSFSNEREPQKACESLWKASGGHGVGGPQRKWKGKLNQLGNLEQSDYGKRAIDRFRPLLSEK